MGQNLLGGNVSDSSNGTNEEPIVKRLRMAVTSDECRHIETDIVSYAHLVPVWEPEAAPTPSPVSETMSVVDTSTATTLLSSTWEALPRRVRRPRSASMSTQTHVSNAEEFERQRQQQLFSQRLQQEQNFALYSNLSNVANISVMTDAYACAGAGAAMHSDIDDNDM